MKLIQGDYVSPASDLLVRIISIEEQNPRTAKFSAYLFNKHTMELIEKGEYEVRKSFITNWKYKG